MNIEYSKKLRQPLQALIDEASRINSFKKEKYWYPLSVATFDVEEVIAAVDSMCSFRTTMWEKTRSFETAFSKIFKHNETIMVNSGSSADLLIAFALVNPMAKLLNPGDEVLVPSVTWPTQIWSAMMAGLKVRLVDTDPLTLNMDLQDMEAKISPKTRAISLVHLMGNPCDMDKVMAICKKHDLILIEDCCESLGAKFNKQPVGTFGTACSYSFFFSHHITTMEGGMIGCQDDRLSDLFRLLRAHGWARNVKHMHVEPAAGLDPRYMFLNWGFNVRPTELQAGFGLIQLERQAGFHEQRKKNAAHFQNFLQQHKNFMNLMKVHQKAECSWFALPIILTPECPFKKDDFLHYLESQGVETRPVVAGNLAFQPVCKLFPDLQAEHLQGSSQVHDRGFYLGLYPIDSIDLLDRLCDIFNNYFKR
jgi:Predicted pyridoxal phosphate-dependent enzyme apparently involved in regulation of cell wall biogenesis